MLSLNEAIKALEEKAKEEREAEEKRAAEQEENID